MASPYASVANDLRWLRETWWQHPESLSGDDIRRGSATLRQLLVNGVLGAAWRNHGFEKEPTLHAPDAAALAAVKEVELKHAASLIVGGGRINEIDVSMIGVFRVRNRTTGIGPEADEGFGVLTTTIARDARWPQNAGDLTPLIECPRSLTAYLNSPGAVRKGEVLTRQNVIDYFANHMGGVHLDLAKTAIDADKAKTRELIAELERLVCADTMSGAYFELLSIGQAIGRAPDMQRLEDAIRGGSDGGAEGVAHGETGGLVRTISRSKDLGP